MDSALVDIVFGDTDLLTVTELARRIPGRDDRKKLHVSTIHRWMNPRRRGAVLKADIIGGRRMVTRTAFAQFLNEHNIPSARQRTGDKSNRRLSTSRHLDEAGL